MPRGIYQRLPLETRFWNKVDKNGPTVYPELSPCWIWTGAKTENYGRFLMPDKRAELAHRLSWEKSFGNIPDGLFVCHHCDNPPCVNPDHLFLGTCRDNIHDLMIKIKVGKELIPLSIQTVQLIIIMRVF